MKITSQAIPLSNPVSTFLAAHIQFASPIPPVGINALYATFSLALGRCPDSWLIVTIVDAETDTAAKRKRAMREILENTEMLVANFNNPTLEPVQPKAKRTKKRKPERKRAK